MDQPAHKPASDPCRKQKQTNTAIAASSTHRIRYQQPKRIIADGRNEQAPTGGRDPSDSPSAHPSRLPRLNHGINVSPSHNNISAIPRRSVSADPVTSARSAKYGHRTGLDSPANKPLPPRPVLDYTNASSPSKCGRSLIDASEKPLRISDGCSEQEWPAITPRSTSAPTEARKTIYKHDAIRAKHAQEMSSAISQVPCADRAVHRSANTSGARSGTALLDSHSHWPPGATVTRSGMAGSVQKRFLDTDPPLTHGSASLHPVHRNNTDLDSEERERSCSDPVNVPRHESLRSRISSGNVATTSLGSTEHFNHFTDFTRPHHLQSGFDSSKIWTSSSDTNAMSVAPNQCIKISRTPLLSLQKEAAAEFKPRDTESISPSSCSGGPIFGSRQLVSTDALRLLDQGTKLSRPLQASSDDNDSDSSDSPMRRLCVEDTPLGRSSETASVNHNPGLPNSLDNGNTTLHDTHPGKRNRLTLEIAENTRDKDRQDVMSQMFDEVDFALAKLPPPSNSPYTEPLETIPSQALFPTPCANSVIQESASGALDDVFMNDYRFSRRYPRLSFSEQQTTPISGSKAISHSADPHADASDEFELGARQHVSRTLSILEGHASPVHHQIDDTAIGQLFGHLKFQTDNSIRELVPVDDTGGTQESPEHMNAQLLGAHACGDPSGLGTNKDVAAESSEAPFNEEALRRSTQQVVSKWSCSTPSSAHVSPPLEIASRKVSNRSIPTKNGQALYTMKPLPKRPSVSGGSSISNPAPRRDGQSAASANNGRRRFPTRDSSLSSSRVNPGSVKAARERLADRKTDRSQPTNPVNSVAAGQSSSNTKKVPQERPAIPAANPQKKVRDRPKGEDEMAVPRSHTPKPSCNNKTGVNAQTSMQYSKSRTVLNKINGLFSTKREKRSKTFKTAAQSQPHEGRNIQNKTKDDGDVKISPAAHTDESPPLTQHSKALGGSFTASRKPSVDSGLSYSTINRKALRGGEAELALLGLAEQMVDKAQQEETSAPRKASLLTFAKIFSDTIIQTREAQISYESAQAAAKSAQISYELVQKSVDMLYKLGEKVVKSFDRP